MKKGKHEWVWAKHPDASRDYQYCKLCGVCRRADDKNSPCRGKVKITLRDFEPSIVPNQYCECGICGGKPTPDYVCPVMGKKK